MTPNLSLTACANGSVERTYDGITEHKHGEYDYWHPKSRVHKPGTPSIRKMADQNETAWYVNEDGIYDILEAMAGVQIAYTDLYGDLVDIPSEINKVYALPDDVLAAEWVQKVSEVQGLSTTVTYRSGKPSEISVDSWHGCVRFIHGKAYFESRSRLLAAKRLLESGTVAKYIAFPDLADAMHVLIVSDPEAGYYDLIKLPSGGHVPTTLLKNEYGVSWMVLAKIPLGKPRDAKTFSCPVCGERSFYAGLCDECVEEFDDFFWLRATDEEKEGMEKKYTAYDEYIEAKDLRKEAEHGEILRLIKSGNWKQCRYMRAGGY